MENNNSNLETVRSYYQAWTGKDFDTAASLIDESVRIEVPINSYGSKTEFMDAVRFTAGTVEDVTLLSEYAGDDKVLLLYDMELRGVGPVRIAEEFCVRNGRIVSILHVHDTMPFRQPAFGTSL